MGRSQQGKINKRICDLKWYHNNKEHCREVRKIWYENNKEEIRGKSNAKVVCYKCGFTVAKNNIWRHWETFKCITTFVNS